MMDPAALFPPPPATQGSMIAKLKEGVAYAWRTPSILLVLIVVGAIGTFGYNFSVVIPLLAYSVLKTDDFGFGLLGSFLGLGSLVGAIATAYMRRVSLRNLFIGSGAFSIIFGAVALSQSFWLSGLLLVMLGLSGIIFSTTSNTLLQLYTSDELRGRVMSINVLLFAGSTPIGGFLVGTLSQLLSVPIALIVCAVLCLLGVIVALAYQRKIGKEPVQAA
jgi:predicted MFS family arabinose efflux permease